MYSGLGSRSCSSLSIGSDEAIELVDMADAEAAERELQSRRIHESRNTLSADTQWTSATDTVFDGTYRRMSVAARGLPWNADGGGEDS